jgi:glycerol-3-phosphate acyltransferase PlsY
MLKGAIPVGLAWYWAGLAGWPLVAVALAPILGHGYSPWLGFKGGKAIAVTGGVWGGLTVGEAPLVMALLLLIWYLILASDGWAVLLTLLTFLAYLLAGDSSTSLLAIWAGSTLILAWKHRADLSRWPTLRPWLARRVRQ